MGCASREQHCCGPPAEMSVEDPAYVGEAKNTITDGHPDHQHLPSADEKGDKDPMLDSHSESTHRIGDIHCEDRPLSVDTTTLGCCDGTTSPCCDQSCLDRLALRACKASASSSSWDQGSSTAQSSSTCDGGKNDKPCADHSRKTRKTYAERLEAIGCICRALVALGQESCCKPSRRLSARGEVRVIKELSLSARTSIDSCCAPSRPVSRRTSTGCKKKRAQMAAETTETQCGDGSCDDGHPHVAGSPSLVVAHATQGVDLEKGIGFGEKEHVILSVAGMTCTGCEKKLVRSLKAHPSIANVKTSLVLSRAEFDVLGTSSAAEVLKYLERTTEFKCEMIIDRGSVLDIMVRDGDAAASYVDKPWPRGVTDVNTVDEKTVGISFDAKVIGARDLVERGWGDGPLQLAPVPPDPALAAGNKHVRHIGYRTLLSAILTIPVLVMAWAPLPEHDLEYASASLALATLVQLFIAGPFYPKALKSLIFARVIEMDLLIVLSTSAAYIFSVVAFGHMVSGRPLPTGEFFETSTLLVTLIMVGRWVSALARQKAVESLSIRSLQTPTAILVAGETDREIDVRLLQYGDMIRVAPDSRIPTDGTVTSGSSEVDESMMTGESRPIEKRARSPVVAGSVNCTGVLLVKVTRLPGDNTISTIAGMVEEAKFSKPKIQEMADRVASYFVPVVIAITIITFCVWIGVGIEVRGQSGSEAAVKALPYAIAVLIVSCPCAIGLAVPMVIVMATGIVAERGVIFKLAESIEVAYKASHVVFDKTGTITTGKLTVVNEWYAGDDPDATKSLLLGLIGGIKHPVSVGVVEHLKGQTTTPAVVSGVKSLTGKGVQGVAKGSGLTLEAGNSRWLNVTSHSEVQSGLSSGYTVFCFTIDGDLAAVFSLEDSVRPDAVTTVKALVDRGMAVHVISGDDDGAVRAIATQLGIPETNVRSRCTPSDKQAYIQALMKPDTSQGARKPKKPKKPVVIFCGDGTNDAVALAQSTVGIHMSDGGTDIAGAAADIVLVRPSLAGVLTVVSMSRASMRRVAFNFGWSFLYNLLAVLLAAGAFVRARIPPEFAGLGEIVSVLPVIGAAVLMKWSKI